MEMAEVEINWCDICGPSVQHKERSSICGECSMRFCLKCYDFHLNSCKYVVTQKYHECVQHHCPIRGYCFTCNELTCVLCSCMSVENAKHEDRNLREAFYLINKELDGSIQDLDLCDKQIESRLELQKISIIGSKECQQCKRSVQEHIDDTCGNEEHFFGRLELLKPRLAKVKENLEFIKGETNTILFLAKWKNPNTVISSIDEVLRMKQFDFANNPKLPIKYESDVKRNPDPSTKLDDSVEELTSALQGMTVKDKKPQVHTSSATNAECIISKMLRISECLPLLVNTVNKAPEEIQKFEELLGKSQHDSVNTFIGHVRKAYNRIKLLNDEKIRLEEEVKSRTEMLENFTSDMASKKGEYERRIQEYEKHLNKDKKEGKSFLPSFFCGIGKTKNHDDSYSPNKREETAADQKSREDLTVMIAERESIIEIMKKEKNDLESRLSALAGEQLTKGNPALTDLGDPNRPMKIGEKYGELYDNEWTESMDLIGEIKTIFPDDVKEHEEIIAHHLYRVLTECYKECKKESELQLEVFGFKTKEILELPDENKEGENISDPHTFDEGSFHRKRKQNAESFAKFLLKEKRLCKNITESWDYRWKSEDLVSKLLDTPFFQRCVYLCWSMVVQDPMMHLDDELPKDSVYDRNLYKEFIQKGDKVKFVVWPALFLHKGGPMLYKGVVQAYSTDDSTTTDSTQKKEHFV